MTLTYSPATVRDLPAIQHLLNRCQLPADDVGEHLNHFLVARKDGRIVGTVGLEVYGTSGFLRSLAVDEGFRGEGIGKALYAAVAEHAATLRIQQLSLLTTTAEHFFAKHGFVRVERNQIPQYVRATKEFRLYCPSTAVCMSKVVSGGTSP